MCVCVHACVHASMHSGVCVYMCVCMYRQCMRKFAAIISLQKTSVQKKIVKSHITNPLDLLGSG